MFVSFSGYIFPNQPNIQVSAASAAGSSQCHQQWRTTTWVCPHLFVELGFVICFNVKTMTLFHVTQQN